jgi:hypothetical protein
MAAEYDFASGFDFSSLSSITGAQLQQTVNGIAPLSNKGLVYYGSSAPDVAGNARYARYLWIDTSATPYVTKYYNGAAWVTIAPGAGGITEAMIAVAAVSLLDDDGVTYKITRAYNDANDVTKARYLLWLDANGKRVEIASLSSVLGTGSGTIAGIAGLAVGTDNQFLRMNGAAIQWETVDFASSITDGSIAPVKLSVGTPGYVIRLDAGGVPTYVQHFPITNIDPGAAAAFQGIRRNSTNLAWEFYNAQRTGGLGVSNAADTSTAGMGGLDTIPHGLAAVPTHWKLFLKNLSTEGAWIADDLIPIESFHEETTGTPAGSSYADNTNIYFRYCDGVLRGSRKDTGAAFTVTRNLWRLVARGFVQNS